MSDSNLARSAPHSGDWTIVTDCGICGGDVGCAVAAGAPMRTLAAAAAHATRIIRIDRVRSMIRDSISLSRKSLASLRSGVYGR